MPANFLSQILITSYDFFLARFGGEDPMNEFASNAKSTAAHKSLKPFILKTQEPLSFYILITSHSQTQEAEYSQRLT